MSFLDFPENASSLKDGTTPNLTTLPLSGQNDVDLILEYPEFGKRGQLGNQLFQFAGLVALGLRSCKKFNVRLGGEQWSYSSQFPNSKTWHNEITETNKKQENSVQWTTVEDREGPHMDVEEHVLPHLVGNIESLSHHQFHGYFQRAQLLYRFRDLFANIFTPAKSIEDLVRQKSNGAQCVFSTIEWSCEPYGMAELKNVCAVHVRRGDYTSVYGGQSICLDWSFYERAMQYFCGLKQSRNSVTCFLFVSDDYDYVKRMLSLRHEVLEQWKSPIEIWVLSSDSNGQKSSNNNTDNKNNDTVADLTLISRCGSKIIGNSTFAWWAAFLDMSHKSYTNHDGKNSNIHSSLVICPSVFFPHQRHSEKLVCPDWVAITAVFENPNLVPPPTLPSCYPMLTDDSCISLRLKQPLHPRMILKSAQYGVDGVKSCNVFASVYRFFNSMYNEMIIPSGSTFNQCLGVGDPVPGRAKSLKIHVEIVFASLMEVTGAVTDFCLRHVSLGVIQFQFSEFTVSQSIQTTVVRLAPSSSSVSSFMMDSKFESDDVASVALLCSSKLHQGDNNNTDHLSPLWTYVFTHEGKIVNSGWIGQMAPSDTPTATTTTTTTQHHHIIPLGYCLPESCILSREDFTSVLQQKNCILADLIPGIKETYRFNGRDVGQLESDYLQMYQQARFAITTKKGGWEALRHYEIVANGCIPIFPELAACPALTMTQFPKHLITAANKNLLPWKHSDSHVNKYNFYASQLLEYASANLTTHAQARSILKHLNVSFQDDNSNRILLLLCQPGINYTREMVIIGLTEVLGPNRFMEYPKQNILYTSASQSVVLNGHGHGFSYARELEDSANQDAKRSSDEQIREQIAKGEFEWILFGKVGADEGPMGRIPTLPFWSDISPTQKVAFLFGGDATHRVTRVHSNSNSNSHNDTRIVVAGNDAHSNHLKFHLERGPCFVRELTEI